MAYRAVIFDLDGVICHTDQYHYQAWKQLADSLGIAFDETVNNQLRGVSRMESLEIILNQKRTAGSESRSGDYTSEEKETFATKKNELYKKLLENMTEKDLSYEVKETLQQLRDKGLLLTIGSSSKNAKFILGRIGLGNFFDAVSDGTNITKSKPDPEVFLKAADMVGIPYDECMVVEDAASGIEAACAAGMHSAAIGDAVKSDRATYKLTTFSDLLQIV
ncbi:MAG: beta-phosphoglucomutase [Ruminococcus flavefaciens]|nr:beta-phosphoglucomutase [Ruminococcus flavefaciens]